MFHASYLQLSAIPIPVICLLTYMSGFIWSHANVC